MTRQYKKTHHRTPTTGRLKNSKVLYGAIGLKSEKTGYLEKAELDATRATIIKTIRLESGLIKVQGKTIEKGSGTKLKYYSRILALTPVTKKPAQSRQGKGVGKVGNYITTVRKGQILMELSNKPLNTLKLALASAQYKLSVPTSIVYPSNLKQDVK